jgi:hypothetical protein
MKKVALVAVILLTMAQIAGAVVEYTGAFDEVKAQSVSQNKPILMEFFAEW